MRAALLAAAVLLAGCGGSSVDPADLPAARLVGDVCRVPLLAGAVVIGTGLVLTAAHVIAGSDGGLAVRLPSGEEHPATVVGFDPARDLALLRAPGIRAPAVALASAEPGTTGLIVSLSRSDELMVVRHEVVREITATGEDIFRKGDVARRALELAADVASGMSGGGVYDRDGNLLGIVFAESRERPVTYAVTAGEIEAFLAEVDPTAEVATGQC